MHAHTNHKLRATRCAVVQQCNQKQDCIFHSQISTHAHSSSQTSCRHKKGMVRACRLDVYTLHQPPPGAVTMSLCPRTHVLSIAFLPPALKRVLINTHHVSTAAVHPLAMHIRTNDRESITAPASIQPQALPCQTLYGCMRTHVSGHQARLNAPTPTSAGCAVKPHQKQHTANKPTCPMRSQSQQRVDHAHLIGNERLRTALPCCDAAQENTHTQSGFRDSDITQTMMNCHMTSFARGAHHAAVLAASTRACCLRCSTAAVTESCAFRARMHPSTRKHPDDGAQALLPLPLLLLYLRLVAPTSTLSRRLKGAYTFSAAMYPK